jgi:isopentenyl diphosphate isomerase/L-lactate dehydrogenase-like FMN-dependent dehydrogenase
MAPSRISTSLSRRRFVKYLGYTPFALPLATAAMWPGEEESLPPHADVIPKPAHVSQPTKPITSPKEALNVFDFIPVAEKNINEISPAHWPYLMTGSDDNLTVQANRDGFQLFQIRPRRFVDVLNVDTSVELFGERYASPIMLAPIGSQQAFHPDGELASARAARDRGVLFILSTVASTGVAEVAKEYQRPLWFQLYPTNDWEVTRQIIRKAERAGCPVFVLTADNPVRSNREGQWRAGDKKQALCQNCHGPDIIDYNREHPCFDGIDVSRVTTHLLPITWDLVSRIREVTRMKLVIKGVVTSEDAELCVKNGVDAIIVSNHGGRQEESLLSTIEVLPEISKAVNRKIPVMIDSGFRRGTDIFKALALGADAICIGRPYIWGLGAFGQSGVERVLELLQNELKLTMQLSGTTSIANITGEFVRKRPR